MLQFSWQNRVFVLNWSPTRAQCLYCVCLKTKKPSERWGHLCCQSCSKCQNCLVSVSHQKHFQVNKKVITLCSNKCFLESPWTLIHQNINITWCICVLSPPENSCLAVVLIVDDYWSVKQITALFLEYDMIWFYSWNSVWLWKDAGTCHTSSQVTNLFVLTFILRKGIIQSVCNFVWEWMRFCFEKVRRWRRIKTLEDNLFFRIVTQCQGNSHVSTW